MPLTARTAPRGLVDRLARDVDAAFPAVVEAHIDGIFSGVRRLAPSHADAEDLTQEAFIRAYRALCKYDTERIRALRLRPWLWTIALNLCRSAARTRSRRVTEVDLGGIHEITPGRETTETDAIGAAMETRWAERLSALSAPQRTAVVLRHVADLPYTEIAAITGRPVGTVKADVHRGIDRLRTILANENAHQEATP